MLTSPRKSLTTRATAPRRLATRLACSVLLLCCAAAHAAAQSNANSNAGRPRAGASQYKATVTQMDYSQLPRVKVYVSITDSAGNLIPDDQRVKLGLYENGTLVSENELSQGYEVYTVLVLDVSGSMKKDNKLDQAKAAAVSFVNMAPPSFRIAVVKFSDYASEVSGFTNDKLVLRSRINALAAGGETALQDGIAAGLNMLSKQQGRKSVVALTDGYENHTTGFYGGSVGQANLIKRAAEVQATVATIGLGEVDEDYLRIYEQTKGEYLHSPTTAQLNDAFLKVVQQLKKESLLEYVTSRPDLDGTQRNVEVKLTVNDATTTVVQKYVVPGFLPHVYGRPLPFALLIVGLMAAPGAFAFTRSMFGVYSFRARHMKRLHAGSPFLNKKDLNYPPDYRPFAEGDLIVVCPVSKTPYFVRSWRMLKCRCMKGEEQCAGHFCYHRDLPPWARRWLDKLSGQKEGRAGRKWLCRCAGDKNGC